MFTICNVCKMEDSLISNGDCSGCGECGSVEQGFLFVNEEQGFLVDEDGFILDENNYEKIACILD